MKLFTAGAGELLHLLLLATGAAAAAAAAKCNADNCARAVTGTARQLTATHFADCQSYLACSVTPAPVTVTSTVTATPALSIVTVVGSYPEKRKRDLEPRIVSAVTNCPTAVPSYASACSGTVRYSSACSCYGASATTTTLPAVTSTTSVTVTLPAQVSTTTVSPTVPALCNNGGLQWAYFADNGNYDPDAHKRDTPMYTGSTDYLHYSSSESVYGQNAPSTDFTVEHRGYLFAPETGTYSFAATRVDDYLTMWIGPTAYSGWTGSNYQQAIRFSPFSNNSDTYTQTLQAGNYYPFRISYSQTGGPAYFDYAVTAPSGYTLIGSDPATAKYTPFVVQYSCDGVLAPQYPPFGQET